MQFALAVITETRRQTFELPGLPQGWLAFAGLVLVAAMCYGVVWMYRREARVGAGLPLRLFMAGLRCAVILLLAAVWLGPSVATEAVRVVHARIPVLVDVSGSMDIPDGDASPAATRAARVNELISAEDYRWLRALGERNELALYAFGEQTLPLPAPWGPPTPAATAPAADEMVEAADHVRASARPAWLQGASLPAGIAVGTDLGQGLVAALSDGGDSPTAGVVLVTDGAANKGMTTPEMIAYARRFRAPLYVVGVGAAQEPPNLRIASISAPASTPKDDPFEVRVEVAATGVAPGPVALALFAQRIDEAGNTSEPQRIATRTVTLGNVDAVELFKIQPAVGGEFIYRAEIEQAPGEVIEADNSRETSVVILDQKLRVLLVAGRPSFDYRRVVALFERDRTIDLSCWLQSADADAVRDGDTQLTELPRRAEELFEYDAIVLMDVNPAELDSSWAINVRRLVDEFGGGLLFQAGPHFTSRFFRDPRLPDLAGILPIAPDPEAEVRLSEAGTYRTRPVPFELPEEARQHPLVALSTDPAVNARIWQGLTGAWWHLPVLREKQLATVLLRGRDARGAPVLMSTQPFGAGRTAFLAFDSTWRWRATAENHFNQFWIQLVRYLAQARRQGATRRGSITLDRDTVNIGEYVKIEAQVLDASFAPWHEPQVDATIEYAGGGQRLNVALTAIPGREGWYSGRAACDQEGLAVIRVPLPGAGDAALRKNVRVQRSDRELATLRMQRESLGQLAEETGGVFVTLAEARDLPALIGSGSEVRPPVRIGSVELWDRGWLLAILAGLLCIEWILRRRNQLL